MSPKPKFIREWIELVKKVKIIGGSLGGLIAAAELSNTGIKTTIVERGAAIGGLYNNVITPFGEQELGMHVIYVTNKQLSLLQEIFGHEAFNIMRGAKVDIGACADENGLYSNSLYPNYLLHSKRSEILNEIIKNVGTKKESTSALDEFINRFGKIAATDKYIPIIEKLWKQKASELTPESIHCYYDLRRIVISNQEQAEKHKKNPILNSIIANPDQSKPIGAIHNGRVGITFKKGIGDLTSLVRDWAKLKKISLILNARLEYQKKQLLINNENASDKCDACIIGVPLYGLDPSLADQMDSLELSIYYFKLSEKIGSRLPAYYILAHGTQFNVSRIVNYDSYSPQKAQDHQSIIAAECLHKSGRRPDDKLIAAEITDILPNIKIESNFVLPKSIPVCSPSLNNKRHMDKLTKNIKNSFKDIPVYFTGMRTDTGTFFSHHTIGAAHAAALDINEKLF